MAWAHVPSTAAGVRFSSNSSRMYRLKNPCRSPRYWRMAEGDRCATGKCSICCGVSMLKWGTEIGEMRKELFCGVLWLCFDSADTLFHAVNEIRGLCLREIIRGTDAVEF